MDSPKATTIFHLLFIFLRFSTTTHGCSTAFCGRNEPAIRFPFRITSLQANACGYPGFDLSCDNNTNLITFLNLPNSGKFSVQAIDYGRQEIWLNDPNQCLPRKLLSLNLSGSPFTGVYYQQYTFYNCSRDYSEYRLNSISCLSGDDHFVFATTSGNVITFLKDKCDLVKVVRVPSLWPFYQEVWSSDLSQNLWLSWSAPNCWKCELGDGRCGFKNNSSREIECFNNPRRGVPKGARYAIMVGVGIPGFLCVIGVLCFIFSRVKSCCNTRDGETIVVFTHSTISPLPPPIISGLDASSLASYPKVILGESRRLPKPDDDTCSICMSEYKPKETIKSIPICNHCFHAECIDEWLVLNATCPICRNSPDRKEFTRPS